MELCLSCTKPSRCASSKTLMICDSFPLSHWNERCFDVTRNLKKKRKSFHTWNTLKLIPFDKLLVTHKFLNVFSHWREADDALQKRNTYTVRHHIWHNLYISSIFSIQTNLRLKQWYCLAVQIYDDYRQTSNISRTLIGDIIVDNSDVVGASPVGAAPTTSSIST